MSSAPRHVTIDHRDAAPRRGTFVRVNGEWLYTAAIERQDSFAYAAASCGRFDDDPIRFHGAPSWLDTRTVRWS